MAEPFGILSTKIEMRDFVNKIILLVSFFVIFCSPRSPVNAADNLRLAAPPSIWVQEEEGTLTGPIITMLTDIFAELDISISPEVLPWPRALSHMKLGKLDVIPVIFHTEERARYMDFTVAYAEVPTSVFVPLGKSFPFSDLKDLRGKQGVMVRDDSISDDFRLFEPQLHVSKVGSYEQMLRMLKERRVDYAIAAHYGFLIKAKQLGYWQEIEVLPHPVASRHLHCALSKRSSFTKYLPKINSKLEQLLADGSLDRIISATIQKAEKR